MADIKTSAMTEKTTPVGSDLLYSSAQALDRKLQISNLYKAIGTGWGNSLFERLSGKGAWNIEIAYKSADSTAVNNSETLVNCTELLWATTASAVYAFEAVIFASAANTTADFKCGWTVPASTTMSWNRTDLFNAASGATPTVLAAVGDAITSGSANGSWGMVFKGVAFTSTTAGNIQFQFAQGTADVSDVKVLKGSNIRFWRLA
jgi:hypothetical protein